MGRKQVPVAARLYRRHVLYGAALLSALCAAACGSASTTVTAPAQARCAVTTQANTASFPPDGGAGTLRISTNRECAWSARSEAGWLALASPGSGQGEATLEFKVASNETPDTRNAAISVNDQRQQISQQGRPCEFHLSSERESVEATGGDRTIHVEATSPQCGWTATADVPWITIVNGREGVGNGSVTFRIEAGIGPPRTGKVTIGRETVLVEQGTGCSVSLSTSKVAIGAEGGPASVEVASGAGCAWTAAASVPWITIIAGREGSGSGTVNFRVDAATGPQRTGTLTIGGQHVLIEQGTGCTVTVKPSELMIGAQGGAGAIQVESGAGCAWTAVANNTWIGVRAGAAGQGTGRVDLAVSANSGPSRTGSATIAGRTISIAQASGCTYSIAPQSQSLAGTAGSLVVSVTTAAGCPWTATSLADWITPSSSSGTGPGELPLGIAANTSPARAGTVTIAGRTITINQASQCTYRLVPPFQEYDANGGNGAVLVIVSGPCTWTAASTVDWITMTSGLSGVGDGLVQFVVAPNGGPARTGVVRIAGENYPVRQGSR